MGFYDDIEESLLEAIEIEKGTLTLKLRENMPAPTYAVPDDTKKD